jgi:hypothetical protein
MAVAMRLAGNAGGQPADGLYFDTSARRVIEEAAGGCKL